jgi:hypothetical protein
VRPRLTGWWERQAEGHPELWDRFRRLPEVQGLAQDAVDVYARAWLMTDQHEGDLWMDDPQARAVLDEYEYDLRIDLLTDLARRLEPELARFWGASLRAAVHRYLTREVVRHFEGAEGIDRRVRQLAPLHIYALPGTDIRLTADSAVVPRTVDVKALLELDQLNKSYRPAGKPGRPKGSREHKVDQEARRAYKMHTAGLTWREISDALWPDDGADEDAIRRRVNHRVKRGRDLSATN